MTRPEQVNLRLAVAERRLLSQAAKSAGVPLSEWVRVVALQAAGTCPTCGRPR